MKSWNNISAYWRAQIIGWTLFAVIALIQRELIFKSTRQAIFITFVVTPVMAALSDVLRKIYDNASLSRGINFRSSFMILVCSFAAALLSSLIITLMIEINNWSLTGFTTPERIEISIIQNWLIFTAWSLIYFWISSELSKQAQSQRAAKAEAEKLKFELQNLRLQLNPHFLFNALNGVIEQIPENSPTALSMLRNLTSYLRYSLNSIDETIVSIQTEIDAIETYLAIQETRFGPRLNSKITTSTQCSKRPIVSFLLQPIVENAIKHGNRDRVLDLKIEIVASGQELKIEIQNTGKLEIKESRYTNRSPIGLKNLRQRLALHYPNRHSFKLSQINEHTVSALLTLEGDPCSGS